MKGMKKRVLSIITSAMLVSAVFVAPVQADKKDTKANEQKTTQAANTETTQSTASESTQAEEKVTWTKEELKELILLMMKENVISKEEVELLLYKQEMNRGGWLLLYKA